MWSSRTYIHMYRGTITSVCRVGGWWWPAEKHMRWREWKIGFDTHLVTLHIAACPGVRCGCCCFQGDRQAGTEGQGGKQAATTTTVIMLLLFRNNKRRTKRENFYQFSCSLCSGCYVCSVCILGWVDGWMGGNGYECCVVLCADDHHDEDGSHNKEASLCSWQIQLFIVLCLLLLLQLPPTTTTIIMIIPTISWILFPHVEMFIRSGLWPRWMS